MRLTGATCGGLFGSSCEEGSTCNGDNKCECDQNLCAIGAKCVSSCTQDTEGTCGIAHNVNALLNLGNDSPIGNGCWAERGPTICNDQATCTCQEGYCSGTTNHGDCDITGYECGKVEGTCLPKCVQWSGVSCYIMGCGGGAECVNNECRCPAGKCLVDTALECLEIAGAPEPPDNPPPRPQSYVGWIALVLFVVFILLCCACKKKKTQPEEAASGAASGREPLLATEPKQ